MKTDIDIKDDIYLLVKDSPIAEAVNGRIVRDGDRDTNSDKEDVVISVLATVNQQNQAATINVNIHVADLKKKVRANGAATEQYSENEPRLRELCKIAADFFDNVIGKEYLLTLDEQRVYKVNESHERVINNKLVYKFNKE